MSFVDIITEIASRNFGSYLNSMNWAKLSAVSIVGFAAGFIAVGIWWYLYWAPFELAMMAGTVIAVLCAIVWGGIEAVPKVLRLGAVGLLILSVVIYSFQVYSILRVSDCGFIDGRLYCLNRYF